MDEKKGILLISITAVLWAFSPIIIKMLIDTISPAFITFFRYGISGIVLLPFLFSKRKEIKKLNRRDMVLIFAVAVLAASLAQTAHATSLIYIDPAVSMFIVRLEPVFVAILAITFLHERIDRKIVGAIAIALFGSFLVSFQEIPILSLSNTVLIGFLFALSAAFFWGSSLVIAKKLVKKISPITLMTFRALIGSLVILGFISGTVTETIAGLSYMDWYLLIFLAIVPTTIGIGFYYTGLKYVSASKTALITLLTPVITLIFSYFIFGEIFLISQLVGGFLILFAIYIIIRERSE